MTEAGARLAARSERAANGCLLWTGALNGKGYGVISVGDKLHLTHRLAYDAAYGPADGLVCHACDVRNCIEPSHLFLGSYADNSADMRRKGRSLRGSKNHMAKLTIDDVRAIRGSTLSDPILADRYRVTPSAIFKVRRRITWDWVA